MPDANNNATHFKPQFMTEDNDNDNNETPESMERETDVSRTTTSTDLSDQFSRRSKAYTERGHVFADNAINGGNVHFGDIHIHAGSERGHDYRRHHGSSHSFSSEASSFSSKNYYMITSPIHKFMGRKLQLQQLSEMLDAPKPETMDHKPRIVVVSGMGGSGKTELCLKFAELQRARYDCFWVDASTHLNAEKCFADIGQYVGKGFNHKTGIYWLAQRQQPWLLILDNADDPEMKLNDLLPHNKHGTILITTRSPTIEAFNNCGKIKLGSMDPEEAINLLLSTAYTDEQHQIQPNDRTVAGNIAERLWFLAKPINQAGVIIRERLLTLESYLRLYLLRRRKLKDRNMVKEEEIDIVTTWEIPFTRIESRHSRAHTDAVALTHLFGFLHFNAIPDRMFDIIWSCDTPLRFNGALPELFQSRSGEDEIADAQSRLRNAIAVLRSFAIIEFDHIKGHCSLHPVVHEWTRLRISDKRDSRYWLRCALHVLAQCGLADDLSSQGVSMALLPHVNACLRMVEEADFSAQISGVFEEEYLTQLEGLAAVYERTGHWDLACILLEQALRFMDTGNVRFCEKRLHIRRKISLCKWNLFLVGDAIDIQFSILWARWLKRPTWYDWIPLVLPEHAEYCVVLSDLTQSLWLGGMRDLARRLGLRAYKGLLHRFGPEDVRTVDAAFNLGRTYLHTGELDASHSLLSYVWKQRIKALGANHLDTLMVMNEVGMLYCAKRQYMALAERLVRRVLVSRTESLGEEHAYTLWSVNDVAKVLMVRSKHQEAISMLERIIPVVERTLGTQHAGMHMTKGNLARAYSYGEDWVSAAQVLKSFAYTIPDDHPNRWMILSSYYRVLFRAEYFEECEQICNTILTDRQQGSSKRIHDDVTQAAASQLAMLYESTDQLTKYQELIKRWPGVRINTALTLLHPWSTLKEPTYTSFQLFTMAARYLLGRLRQ